MRCAGSARWFNDTADVLSIDDDDLDETIAFVQQGRDDVPVADPARPARNRLHRGQPGVAPGDPVPRVGRAVRARRRADRQVADGDTVVLDLSDAETARVAVARRGGDGMTAPPAPRPNLKALYTDPSYEPTLDEWNWLVHEGGAAYKSELLARTVFESELFGMNTYILMSMMEDYLRVPDRIRTIRRHATPAELVAPRPADRQQAQLHQPRRDAAALPDRP